MKKVASSITAIIFSAIMVIYSISHPIQNYAAVENQITYWSAPSWEKVLLDYPISNYTQGEAAIKVSAARAEYESGQLIITPEKDIKSYDVIVNDLNHNSKSGVIFSKSNINVYNQKYIYISRITTTIKVPTGYYPDGLLPFEAAKAAGENNIKAGNNQAIFVTFNVPENQEPGLYEGTLKIVADGKERLIPIELNIWDLTVSTTVNSRSLFGNHYHYYYGELDTTQSMLNKYHDALLEYRLAPQLLVTDTKHSDEDIQYYTELAYSYAINPRCSNIALPWKMTYDSTYKLNNIDTEIMEKYIRAFAQKSFEEGFDMLSKTVSYIQDIDESDLKNIFDTANLVCDTFDKTLERVASEIEADSSITSSIKAQVATSIRKIPNLVTTPVALANDPRFENIKTFCPTFDKYHTPEMRELYSEQEEEWWYGCVGPRNPYPTYHLDDLLLSSRVLSWMQADYGVLGNLYWATNIVAIRDGHSKFIEDPYQTADRYIDANGDGFLFYPGKKYGIVGPIGSRRLHSIRDGLEEFEIINALKEQYLELSSKYGITFDADNVLDLLFDKLYNGTQMHTSNKIFGDIRNSLAQIAMLANGDAQAAVTSVEENNGIYTFNIVAEDGYKVMIGTTEADSEIINGKKVYIVNKQLGSDKTLNITVTNLNKSYDVSFLCRRRTASNIGRKFASRS